MGPPSFRERWYSAGIAPALATVARTDGATRLAIDVSISGARFARILENRVPTRGLRWEIVADNGPAGTSPAMFQRLELNGAR